MDTGLCTQRSKDLKHFLPQKDCLQKLFTQHVWTSTLPKETRYLIHSCLRKCKWKRLYSAKNKKKKQKNRQTNQECLICLIKYCLFWNQRHQHFIRLVSVRKRLPVKNFQSSRGVFQEPVALYMWLKSLQRKTFAGETKNPLNTSKWL